MPEHSNVDEVPCNLIVNGVPFRSVSIRNGPDNPDDFDVVVCERVLGLFALHSGFEIEVCEPGSGRRRVSLDGLKRMLAKNALLALGDLPKASEIAECQLFARVDDIQIPHWESDPRSVLRRQDACVRYVQRIFYRVGIPHLIAGTTFSVPSSPTARIPLKRAGFRQSEISPSALVEPRTGCAIQLVERDPRS
jgi:hypothetical protein